MGARVTLDSKSMLSSRSPKSRSILLLLLHLLLAASRLCGLEQQQQQTQVLDIALEEHKSYLLDICVAIVAVVYSFESVAYARGGG